MLVQRSPLFCAPGLVKFVPAVARLFCLALPGSFLTMFAQNKGDPCRSAIIKAATIGPLPIVDALLFWLAVAHYMITCLCDPLTITPIRLMILFTSPIHLAESTQTFADSIPLILQ